MRLGVAICIMELGIIKIMNIGTRKLFGCPSGNSDFVEMPFCAQKHNSNTPPCHSLLVCRQDATLARDAPQIIIPPLPLSARSYFALHAPADALLVKRSMLLLALDYREN